MGEGLESQPNQQNQLTIEEKETDQVNRAGLSWSTFSQYSLCSYHVRNYICQHGGCKSEQTPNFYPLGADVLRDRQYVISICID